MESISHENLRDQINALDRRVLVVETELVGAKKDIKENHAISLRIGQKVDELHSVLIGLVAESKAMKSYFVIGLGVFGVFMTLLQLFLEYK